MKKNIFGLAPALVRLALVASGAGITGCGGPSVSTVCDDICACTKCADADRQKCISEGNAARDEVDKIGCSSEFEDELSCFHANISCTTDTSKICPTEAAALKRCEFAK